MGHDGDKELPTKYILPQSNDVRQIKHFTFYVIDWNKEKEVKRELLYMIFKR